MGLPMARRLIAAGHTVYGFDPSADRITSLEQAGGYGGTAGRADVDRQFGMESHKRIAQ